MDQELALALLLSGKSILLTGPAGSGKTHVLREFIRTSKKRGKSVSVTATTGLAASHLGGSTIHSWSGIGISDELHPDFFEYLSKTRKDTIKKTDILIIDEISMLHDYRLDMVDRVVRSVREELDEPFGGIQVVFSGDFFQLPPVNRVGNVAGSYVVTSEVWQELDIAVCYLKEQHRQDDEGYLDILDSLRRNKMRRHHAEQLLGRTGAEIDDFEEVTELHVTNIDVDRINQRKLDNIDKPLQKFYMSSTGATTYVESLKRACLAPETLELKKGALVMFLKNNQEKKYVNGTIGRVVDFHGLTTFPIVELRDGRTIMAEPEDWEMRDGNRKRAGLTQVPLRLAWAITIHKSQGMTLDAARIDLRKAFVPGMGYVALSRVKNLESLSLHGINKTALQISPEALEIDAWLRTKSIQDAEAYEYLREELKKQKKKPEPKKSASNWTAKIEKMRETYPNAFRPWRDEDDKKLVEMCSSGAPVPINTLTKQFGRHPRSIRLRLSRHFDEDFVVKIIGEAGH